MNKGWIYRESVKAADAGQTVLDFYRLIDGFKTEAHTPIVFTFLTQNLYSTRV